MRKAKSPLAIMAVIIVILLAVGAGARYSLRETSTDESPVPTSQNQVSSRFVEYTKESYEIVKDDRHVLFFFANWCPTCRPADAELEARSSEIPENLKVIRVNYNDTETDADEQALANEYGITYQHTFILLENGQEVKRWNGGAIDELLSRVN